MVKKAITARLDADLAGRLDAYVEGHGITRTDAMEKAIRDLLEADQETTTATEPAPPAPAPEPAAAERDAMEALKSANADLRAALVDTRAMVSTLTAQLAVKDTQIAAAHELAGQAQRLQMADVARASLVDGRESLRDRIRRMFGI